MDATGLRPSQFIRERSQTTEERLAQASYRQRTPRIIELIACEDANTRASDVPVDRPLFTPHPSEFVLQSYNPFQTYEIVISFRNNDRFARTLRLEPINHPHFTISGMKNKSLSSGRVAPGIEVQFLLTFTPEEEVDYLYNLVCVTDREKFIVPIRGFGARGMLDFPDEIVFSGCAVRFKTTKTLYIRNIGNKPAKFILDVPAPFESTPSSGYLDVEQSMQVDVHFFPEISGSFTRSLLIKYDTGEILTVSLIATSEDANIRLEKNSLKLDNTYITLSSSKALKINNKSEVMATNQSVDLCDLAPITQKYKNLRREVENDPLLFNNPVFCLQPCEGIIWPNAQVEMCVLFSPQESGPNSQSAYCEITGREKRLPIGDGIGPKARFSYDILDIEEVFINTTHAYEVLLENRGEIEFRFSIVKPDTMFGPKFSFVPESGVLGVGKTQAIRIQFHSDILGVFTEEFAWKLEGSMERLSLTFRGNVVGPVFHFQVPELDFGRLSHGFLSCRTLTLINTSHIPMTFKLRIPNSLSDGSDPEFVLNPDSGTISSLGTIDIRVEFTPHSIKKYEEVLVVDVDRVGTDLLLLPVLADSIVPEVKSTNYGDCFLTHPYVRNVELVNETGYPAKYELLCQEESAKNVYAYASRNGTGVIMPFSAQTIQVDIQIKRLGQVNFPIFIKVFGNDDMPLGVDISASGIGPNIILSANEINWGKIQVLKEVSMSLTLTNDSPISANFTCATVSESSVFRIEQLYGTIAPGANVSIDVTAYLDDCLKFTDILKIGVQSDGIHEVQLVARGMGSTITFEEGLRNVDFSDVFSNRECSREFTLVNKGRRSQTLHWSIEEERFVRKDVAAAMNQVFEVFPQRFTMKPNQQQIIVIKGYSNKAMKCKEALICQGTIDKDPARRLIVESNVTANFVNPLIDVSPPQLKFISAHTRDEDFELLTEELCLTNTSSLPLHLSFKCPIPYSVEPNEIDHRLNQNESITVCVRYDPKYNTSRVSCKDHARLVVTYSEHPQKDYIELFSEVTFPNLSFSATSLTFGCIPNDTEHKKTFQITNCSTLPVEYTWAYLESSMDVSGVQEVVSVDKRFPIHQVFDILPTRGTLLPGEVEIVEVTFYGRSGGLFVVTAICDVVGGPKYEVNIKGEASVIEYTIDKQVLDFGTQLYQDILEQDLILSNTGRVTFDYSTIIYPVSTLTQKVMICPSSGTISPHGKQKITVRFCPCVPEAIDDCFYVQLAFFEPFKIRVTGTGVFPHLQMNIPRISDHLFDGALTEARITVTKSKRKLTEVQFEVEVEAEAERILLRQKTLDFLELLNDDIKSKGLSAPKARMIGSPILMFKSSQSQKLMKDKRASNSIVESSEVKLATFICNFGNVIRNTNRKKTFRLTNRSLHPISFLLDKSILTGTGFSIEPDRVKLLPGHPYYESIEFQVSFTARSQNIGTVHIELPINILGGPTTTLLLRADVTLPDLSVSSNEIDFGEIVCGRRKTVSIQLQNKNTVACEWTTIPPDPKEAAGGSKRMPKKKSGVVVKEFDIVPSSGLLQPGEKIIVLVQFSPTEEKDYDAIIPFKVSMNGQPINIHLFGRGFKPVIQFEPESLVMGPILPCSEGIDSKFYIFNPTNYPVEIYSLEFDQIYLEEEEMLRNVDGYEGSAIFLPPREPGQGLPEHIVEAANLKMKQKANPQPPEILVPTRLAATEGVGVGELIDTSVKNMKLSNSATDAGELGVNIILHGPPYSGRTTQAKKLQKIFGAAYLKIDDIIEASPNFDVTTYLDPVQASVKLKEPRSGDMFEHSLSKGQVLGSDDLSSSRAPGDHFDQFDHHVTIPDEIITEFVKARLQRDDCTHGVIIDGLESKYTLTPMNLLKSVLKALGDKRKTFFFTFTIDPNHIKEREAALVRQSGDKDLDPMQVKDISEEEYDNLTEVEREHYDIAMMKYKRKVKELQDRKKLERKHWEEEVALRVGERKAEEENSKKKKTNRRLTRQPSYNPDKEKLALSPGAKGDLKGAKGEKGNVSPRLARRLQARDAIDRPDKENMRNGGEIDELSSRFTLSEYGDTFINETTFRRLEFYNSTLEPILSVIRDGERHSSTRQIVSSAAAGEKKIPPNRIKAPPLSSTNTATNNIAGDFASNISVATDEAHLADESGPQFHEINGSLDEDAVFKIISEFLPSVPKSEEVVMEKELIPPPYIEQIVYFPAEREPIIQSRLFQLQPPLSPNETEEEGSGLPDGTAVGSATVKGDGPAFSNAGGNNSSGVVGSMGNQSLTAASLGTNVAAAGASSSGNSTSNSKRVRPTSKMAEDAKIAENLEEDPDKDGVARFRWILQPKERKELSVKFGSNEIGKFDQTLQFEIVGSKARFALVCVGHCKYSQIVSDFKKIFPKWRKSKEEKTITHGEYVASTGIFEFGPLLYSKPREKYLERFPENRAILTISNPSLQEIKVFFTLKNDIKSDVFFFDPPAMDLMPGQSQNFFLWAYPRSAIYFEDMLVCCVKDNPEPYCYKISVVGVKPELEIDKRQLSFDKMLTNRSERREIRLKNNTLMPVGWKLVQVEVLGDEFAISPLEGVIESYQEQIITAEFKGTKPVVISRRSIRVEVSDTEKLGGVVQEVPILVTAEAYDVSMDLHFPKGYEGGLDFGVLKVMEEGRQMCTLKNKGTHGLLVCYVNGLTGKYEVGFKFVFENKDLNELFTITPQQSTMAPSDKPFAVQILFKANREILIKDNTSLKCHYIEPTTGEVTSIQTVKLCARAVFSRFSILPVREVNFGALVFGTKLSRQFTVENLGEFDFRYSIYKIIQGTNDSRPGGKLRTNSRPSKNGRATSPPTQKILNRKELVKQADAANFGAFTVFPTSGIVASGTKHQITVEFHSDTPGSFEESVAIDISDRSPNDYLDVIEYRLIGESCVPGINTSDFASIFEEQTVCKRLELFNTQANVYAEEDRVFYFGAYLAGQQAQVRYKISNPFKVPCDVAIATRPRSRTKSDAADFAFDIEPKKLTIPSHEHRYVTVSFHPTSIQSYAGIFEAVVENVDQSKSKTLTFEIRGEGTLPRVTIEKPILRNKNGWVLMKFRRMLLNTSQSLSLVVRNEGIISAKVKLEWLLNELDAFECNGVSAYHVLKPQETKSIDIKFRALSIRKFEGELKVRVVDNSFEDSVIQVSGEGYADDVTFELPNEADSELLLGDCFIGNTKQTNFLVTNHSTDVIRTVWATDYPEIVFSPTVAHLRPKSQKEITVSFCPKAPAEINHVKVVCKVTKIKYLNQSTESDWDDRLKSIRWQLSD
ncbi:hypothetical protein HK101_009853, partial [Irineochytrium annulatum]